MSSPYLSQIQMWALNWAPRQWMACNGQSLSITQNSALFALLGTNFGGNGTTNFNLPNFQGRVPVGFGQGSGLSNRAFAQIAGGEVVTLGITNLPAHSHSPVLQATTAGASANTPSAGAFLGSVSADSNGTAINAYTKTAGTLANLGGVGESSVGGSQPIPILNPYLAIGFTIAVQGIFPSRS